MWERQQTARIQWTQVLPASPSPRDANHSPPGALRLRQTKRYDVRLPLRRLTLSAAIERTLQLTGNDA